jgi:hypothetical protein
MFNMLFNHVWRWVKFELDSPRLAYMVDTVKAKSEAAPAPAVGHAGAWTLTFEGLFKDQHHGSGRAFGGTNTTHVGGSSKFGGTKGIVEKFLVQLESGGHNTGHIALQNNHEVFYTCGIPERDFRRHGKLSDEKAPQIAAGFQITDPMDLTSIAGTVDVIGGPWQNAVYKATKNVDRSGG